MKKRTLSGLTIIILALGTLTSCGTTNGNQAEPAPTTTISGTTAIVVINGKKYEVGEHILEWTTGNPLTDTKHYKIHTQNMLYAARRDGTLIYNKKIFDSGSVHELLGDLAYTHKNKHFKTEQALIDTLKKAN